MTVAGIFQSRFRCLKRHNKCTWKNNEFLDPHSRSTQQQTASICMSNRYHFLCSTHTLYGAGATFIPICGSSDGGGAPSGRQNRKLCMIDVKKRNISILARFSPRQLRGPATTTLTLFTLSLWPWPSEVLFTQGELYPRQTSQPREDCLGEGQV